MLLNELAIKGEVFIPADHSAGQAAARLSQGDLPGMVVVSKGKILGVVTPQCLMNVPRGRSLLEGPLRKASSIPESMDVLTALGIILEEKVGLHPIVNKRGNPIGMVSLYDLANYLFRTAAQSLVRPSPKKKQTILIVDDSSIVRKALQIELGKAGLETITAASGAEALEKLGSDIDLVLLDLHMPDLDGIEVLKRIRSTPRTKALPVIMLTAMGDLDTRIDAFAAGADDYLLKPYHATELQVRIFRILERLRIRAQVQRESELRWMAEEQLSRSEKLYQALFEQAGDGLFILDTKGRILSVNESFARMHGFTPEEMLKLGLEGLDVEGGPDLEILARVLAGETMTFEVEHYHKDGHSFPLEVTTNLVSLGQERVIIAIHRDLSERKQAEKRERLAYEVLNLLNRSERNQDTIKDLLVLMKQHTDFEAVGIRLREGYDFPYYASNGFPYHFMQAECYLCSRDEAGAVSRDERGAPRLEGLCGWVLSGYNDPENPNFTPAGSFWTNDSAQLLESPATKDQRLHARNRCIHEGFHSFALIPLRVGEEIVGLLQFNDRRPNRFTPESIRFFEGLGASIGIALSRRQNEEALRESEKRYRLLAENTTDVIWTASLDGRFTYVSPSIAAETGFTPEEFLTLDFSQVLSPESYQRVRKRLEQELKSPVGENLLPATMEARQYHKNGSMIEIETSVNWILDAAGQPVGLQGVSRNISERKRVEETLRISAEMLDTAPSSITVHDFNGKFLYANRRTLESHGYSEEELMALNLRELDVPESAELIAERMQLIAEKGEALFEVAHFRKDGTSFPLEVYVKKVKWRGIPAMLSIATDITERKQAEEVLRKKQAMLVNAQTLGHMGSWEWDIRSGQAVWSEEVFRIYGLDPEKERPNYDVVIETLTPECKEDFLRAIDETLSRGKPFEGQYCILRPDGSRIFTHTKGEVVRDSQGNPIEMFGMVQDITEWKKAVETIEASEVRYRSLVESSADHIFMLDLDGNYISSNSKVREVPSGSPDALIGKNLRETHHPEVIEFYLSKFREVIESKQGVSFEHWLDAFPGRAYHIDTLYPILRGGEVASVGGICHDITERKRMEQMMNESLLFNQTILETSPIGILTFKASGECISANPAAALAVGGTVEQLLAQNFRELDPWKKSGMVDMALEALSSGAAVTCEIYTVTSFGKAGWFETSFVPFVLEQEDHLLLLFSEITERKLAEEFLHKEQAETLRFKMLLENIMANMMTGLLVTGNDGRIIIINQSGQEILWITEDEAVGRMIGDLASDPVILQELVLPTGKTREASVTLPDGREIPLGFTSSVLRDAQGVRVGTIIVFKDLTEVKEIEKKLRDKDKLATIGEISRGIAHEIKNPIFAITSGIQVLQSELKLAGDQSEIFNVIYNETMRVDRLIRELLLFGGPQKLTIRPLDLAKLTEEVISLNKGLLQSKGIKLRKKYPSSPPLVPADRDKIIQVLLNIIQNAIDVSGAGDTIEIVCKTKMKEGFTELRIMDRGPGISEKHRQKIFDPFFSTKRGGSGMGLAICKRIVIDHGGDIRFEPRKKGRGASFVLTLPLGSNDAQHDTDSR